MAVAKINFRTSRLAYLIFALVLGSLFINIPINLMVHDAYSKTVSPGSYVYLLVVLFAVFVPAQHFRKFMNLNVKKADYIKGCAATYVILAFFASAFNSLLFYTVEGLLEVPNKLELWNLLNVFGWSANGMLVSFIQQFAFLLLLAASVHLITTLQTFWYGWVVDALIAAVLAVFIPIRPLRAILLGFFDLIIFNHNAPLQITYCLGLAVALYLLSIIPVKNKPV